MYYDGKMERKVGDYFSEYAHKVGRTGLQTKNRPLNQQFSSPAGMVRHDA
jgi:hypothetical protein